MAASPPGSRGMQMLSLWDRLAALFGGWEDLSLENRHPVEMVANCARSQ
jgi:hypothetical protein